MINKKEPAPIFLDCEASSLDHESYPIEIAWGAAPGEIESHLINPYGYPQSYTNWDIGAQAVHGLSRNFLSKNGRHPETIAKRMDEMLSGQIVYTDAPDFDGFWCRRLFEAVNRPLNIEFRDIDVLFRKLLPQEFWYVDMLQHYSTKLELLKVQARTNVKVSAHRASNDVLYLLELYRLVLSAHINY